MLPTAESIQIILPIASIFFLVLSFKRPIYGIIAYFIIMNAKIGDMYPALGAIRFELLSAVVVLISIFFTQQRVADALPHKNPLNMATWVLFFVGMISVAQALYVSYSWENGGYNLLKMFLFFIMTVSSIHDREDLKKMILAFALVTAWTAYEPVVNYINGISNIHAYGEIAVGRYGAAAGHVALANTLNQGIPIVFYSALSQKKKLQKYLFWAALALLVLGVVFTKSRGGFVGFVVIAFCMIYFSKKRMKSFVIVAMIFLFLLPIAGGKYLSHIETITEGIHGGRSQMDRYLGLVNGISMMIKRPIMGVGIGGYPKARSHYFGYYFWSHNLYGELFGELGLSSVVWFYWIYVMFKNIKRLKEQLGEHRDEDVRLFFNLLIGVQTGLIFRLVIGNFTHCAFIGFWFLMAAIIVSIEMIMAKSYGPHLTD